MLGWELAPHITGGLGVACAGLAHGLSEQGTEVLFLLPRVRGDERAGRAVVRSPRGTGFASDPLDSALRPYLTRREYAASRERGEAGVGKMQGGYGATLFDEVERFAAEVTEVCRREPFDVVHAHDWMTFAAGRAAKRASGRPLVCHVHSTERDRRPFDPDADIVAEEQAAFDAADRIVCVSDFAADALCARYRVDATKLRTIRNAPSDDVDGDGALGARALPPTRAPRILFLGRLTHQKGPFTFLEATARVLARMPEAEAYVCGEGELAGPCQQRARELGIQGRVTFPGFLQGEAVREMFAASDVFVLPSVSEPFGLVALEAVACGVPTLVSRQSGVAEVLPSALQFDYWNIEDLAEKILAVLRLPALREALVASGRAELSRLDWEASALLLSRVYEEVLA